MDKAAFAIQLQGFPQANRDAKVELVNQATGQRVERQPFLDGSLLVRDLDPGLWEMTVSHPNLVAPIDRRIVRLFPQRVPVRVPVIVPPDLFRDTPIRDVPDADVGPVRQTVGAVQAVVAPLAAKQPGEAIRAADFNALATAIGDLAGAVSQLTTLVAPQGHDHPEIAEKIDEVQGNLRRFSDAFGQSLLELQRQVMLDRLHGQVATALDRAALTPELKAEILTPLDSLRAAVQDPTPTFTAQVAVAGQVAQQRLADLVQANPDLLQAAEVQQAIQLTTVAGQARAATPVGELANLRRIARPGG